MPSSRRRAVPEVRLRREPTTGGVYGGSATAHPSTAHLRVRAAQPRGDVTASSRLRHARAAAGSRDRRASPRSRATGSTLGRRACSAVGPFSLIPSKKLVGSSHVHGAPTLLVRERCRPALENVRFIEVSDQAGRTKCSGSIEPRTRRSEAVVASDCRASQGDCNGSHAD